MEWGNHKIFFIGWKWDIVLVFHELYYQGRRLIYRHLICGLNKGGRYANILLLVCNTAQKVGVILVTVERIPKLAIRGW